MEFTKSETPDEFFASKSSRLPGDGNEETDFATFCKKTKIIFI